MTDVVIPLVTELTVHGPKTEHEQGCPECNYDRHRCPGCGDWLYHGTECCLQCRREIARGER